MQKAVEHSPFPTTPKEEVEYNQLSSRLTDIEIKHYFNLYKQGNMEARTILIERNMNLVRYFVFRLLETDYKDKEELVSVGTLGLIKSVDTYNITKNYAFSTYAMRCIRNAVYYFLRQQKESVPMLSVEAMAEDENHPQILPDQCVCIEQDYEEKEIQEIIMMMLEQLQEPDKEIMKLYFRFYGRPYTHIEIAQQLGIHRNRVSRIIIKTLNRMRIQLIRLGVLEELPKVKVMERNQKRHTL